MNRGQELIGLVEKNLKDLADVFRANINDYFYTEKELHSYFYHLSLKSGAFCHKNHYLIHTEYPSPFKCSFKDESPFVCQEAINAKAQRSHVDLVLVNPAFIDWLAKSGFGLKPLTGIGNARFDLYIGDFYDTYARFNFETRQPVLLYALEFKFLRHSYAGSKYPARGIHQDIAKLRLLREFAGAMPQKINFVSKTKAVIFVGERTRTAGQAIICELGCYDPDEYTMITRMP